MTADATLKLKRLGVLDIGSNSVRLVLYEMFGAHFSPVYNEKILAGLGRDLRETGCLSESGKSLTLNSLARFKTIAQAQDLGELIIGATAALRVAKDAPDFIAQVKAETRLDIRPVSGEEEARLSAMGLIAAEPRAEGLAADLGGASLELISVSSGKAGQGISLPLGPFEVIGDNLNSPELYNTPDLRTRITEHISRHDFSAYKGKALYLIGGAWRNLASIEQKRSGYPMRTLQNFELGHDAARNMARWSFQEGREDVLAWPSLRKRRAETLPYSGLLLDILLEIISPSHIVISSTGLREGLIYDAMPEGLKSRDSLLDGCRDLARGNLQAVDFGNPLYQFIVQAAVHFPYCFDPPNEIRLRHAACYLAGIGKGLHPDYRAGLVFENVLYAPLAGLTHKERAYLALILYASYTSKNSTPNNKAIELLLTPDEQASARIYGAAMRLGVIASGRTPSLLKSFNLSISNKRLCLSVAHDQKHLISQLIEYRLSKLGQKLGMDVKTSVE